MKQTSLKISSSDRGKFTFFVPLHIARYRLLQRGEIVSELVPPWVAASRFLAFLKIKLIKNYRVFRSFFFKDYIQGKRTEFITEGYFTVSEKGNLVKMKPKRDDVIATNVSIVVEEDETQ